MSHTHLGNQQQPYDQMHVDQPLDFILEVHTHLAVHGHMLPVLEVAAVCARTSLAAQDAIGPAQNPGAPHADPLLPAGSVRAVS